MTYITLSNTGDEYRIEAIGHATGSSECCAALSALVCTLAGYLGREPNIRLLKQKTEPGYFEARFSGGSAAELLFGVFAFGLSGLARAFPQYISCERGGSYEKNTDKKEK